jgi:SAM-dependent methyltransferase
VIRPAAPAGPQGAHGTWADAAGTPVEVPEPPSAGSCYGPIGDFQGAEYERNAFALGTPQEVAFLCDVLDLRPGVRVVDVGSATGRHSRALAAHGVEAVGIDLSHGLVSAGAAAAAADGVTARFVQADARCLPLPGGCADVVLCLCQGGFGITPWSDQVILGELARVLRRGGRLVLTAFSLAFAARHLAPGDAIDLSRGLVHTRAEVRGRDAERRTFDLWTACYTPSELGLLCGGVGLRIDRISGAQPGAYGVAPLTLSDPEILVLATKH